MLAETEEITAVETAATGADMGTAVEEGDDNDAGDRFALSE